MNEEQAQAIYDAFGGEAFEKWYRGHAAASWEKYGQDGYIISISDFLLCWRAALASQEET